MVQLKQLLACIRKQVDMNLDVDVDMKALWITFYNQDMIFIWSAKIAIWFAQW